MKLGHVLGALAATAAIAAPVKRSEDTDNLALRLVATEDVEKRAEDTDNLIYIVYTKDGKVKRSEDTDNLALRLVATEDVKRSEDTDNLALRLVATEDVKRSEDTDNLALRLVATEDVEKRDPEAATKRAPKLISPYSDDVAKADAHAVLGE